MKKKFASSKDVTAQKAQEHIMTKPRTNISNIHNSAIQYRKTQTHRKNYIDKVNFTEIHRTI